MRTFGRLYPDAGYGGMFMQWLMAPEPRPYNSWGNGSAMRVVPVGLAFTSVDEVLREAERSAAVTHDHPEGIKGAQAVALAVFLARSGAPKNQIRDEIADRFEYDLERSVDDIRPGYGFDVSCQGSVPEAIIAFLDSNDVEHAIRLAISLGGDAGTQATIAGGIAQAWYGEVPLEIVEQVKERVPGQFLDVLDRFHDMAPTAREQLQGGE
jgi:ADP-ribosylglycohydrolase